MAILNSCPGLEVKVVSNEKILNEYADSHARDPRNTSSSYIEVESEGAFKIHMHFTNQFRDRFGVRVEIQLDGQNVNSSLIRKSQLRKAAGHDFTGARSRIGGKWHVSDFKFSEFVLGERNIVSSRMSAYFTYRYRHPARA